MSPAPPRAMVLAAGLGTRLRPLTDRLPKPAVPLCGVAPVRFTLARLAAAGVREAVVNTHWLPERIEEAVGDPAHLGLSVRFSHEPDILGTGGGLAQVRDFLGQGTFVVANGKLLFEADVAGALATHRRTAAQATLVVRPLPPGRGYRAVELDPSDRIRRIRGRPVWEGPLAPTLFTGVQVLEPEVLERLPLGVESDVIDRVHLPLLEADGILSGHRQPEGVFAEPSTPARYLEAVVALLGGRVDLAGFPGADPFAGMGQPSPGLWVHPSASVAPTARLLGPCYVGPGVRVGAQAEVGPFVALETGCTVDSGARVRRAVVWPDTRIQGDERLDTVIALGRHRVAAGGD